MHQKIHWPPKKPTGPPKTCNDPNVMGIYDFTREVAHFFTLGLYITKNKYELTLPSKKNTGLGPVENKLWWPELARQPQKGMRPAGGT